MILPSIHVRPSSAAVIREVLGKPRKEAGFPDVYIDMHCHRRRAADALEIMSFDSGDFDAEIRDDGLYTLGLHPWFLSRQSPETALRKIAAAVDDPRLLAIGECGLDKAIETSLHLQMEVFIGQIRLSEQIGKPLIIHCVRAFNELAVLKKSEKSRQPWIIHGFTGKPETVRQLGTGDFYFSFGKSLLNVNSQAAKTLAELPLARLFLETDAADTRIDAIYAVAAKILGLSVDDLRQRIFDNFIRVFPHE